jgi:serine protease
VLVTTNAGDARVRVSLGSFAGATVCAHDALLSAAAAVPPAAAGRSDIAPHVDALEQRRSGGPLGSTSEVLVLYHPQAVTASSAVGRVALASELAARSGARLVRAGIGSQHDLMRLPAHAAEAARAALERDPRVAAVVPNLPVHRLGAPSDPFYAEQWWAWCFGLEEAWAVTTGEVTEGSDPTVVIAVIDDGFNVAHRDLAAKLLPGYDFAEGNDDVRGAGLHGTHVAGIALAAGNNGAAIAGVAHGPSVRLLPVKVFPDDRGRTGTTDALLNGMRWAVGLPVANVEPTPYPAQVVNLSLGVGPDEARDALFAPTVAQMRARGAVVAAGPGGRSPTACRR